MKKFMDKDFLLDTETAKRLYHDHAAQMPIIDYHCHIDPVDIAEDRRYDTITQLWLGGDHYKWRAMRACGVPEEYITGNAPDEEKFLKWAQTLPKLIGNPLYHWTHLELQRYFSITEPLCPETAADIYRRCNEMLKSPDMSVRGIIRKSNVKVICTTDDPLDDLAAHKKIAADPNSPAAVYPAFRPDRAMRADKPGFADYVKELEKLVGYSIDCIDDMRRALADRIEYFANCGCRVSDHGLDYIFCHRVIESELDDIFERAKRGRNISMSEQLAYHTEMLIAVGREYVRRGWVMQLHFGCIRNASSRSFARLGADTGFDAVDDAPCAEGLAALLNTLESSDALPKTIIYSLDPSANAAICSVMGSFQTDSPIPGKMQHGSAWWFNDNKPGMEAQLTNLMSMGALGCFVGMLTDSRSFLSYTRHEYFRRILCGMLGRLVENGEYPDDMKTLGGIVEDISYNNALRYFDF